MLELLLPQTRKRPLRILCLGAHCDDIDIGCGGTLLKLLSSGRFEVTWAVLSSNEQRARELRASARSFLRRAAFSRVLTYEFTDAYFPAQYQQIKKTFEELKKLPDPDVVFTHCRFDLHQDHRIVAELTWNAFRRHLIFEYEIPKYEGGLQTPNVYVRLTRQQAQTKARVLFQSYQSQHAKPWFRADTFQALMRLRGIEAGGGVEWAEGFHASKVCIS